MFESKDDKRDEEKVDKSRRVTWQLAMSSVVRRRRERVVKVQKLQAGAGGQGKLNICAQKGVSDLASKKKTRLRLGVGEVGEVGER